jgi:ankyrin repeat protein
MCQYLIDRGANVGLESIATRGNWGTETTALHCAIRPVIDASCFDRHTYLLNEERLIEVGRLLIDNGADLNKKDSRGWTPLGLASLRGIVAFCELLICNGASLRVGRVEGSVVANTAQRNTIALPKSEDALDTKYSALSSPLHIAAGEGHVQLCSVLLEHRQVDIEACNGGGATVLHLAAEYGHVDVVKLLLNRGANVAALSSRGETPLHFAVKNGHRLVCSILLDRGADVSSATPAGVTPLHVAARSGGIDVCQLLLERGADVNRCDHHGNTALHDAVQFAIHSRGLSESAQDRHGLELCQRLLESGALVDAAGGDGKTALHTAAQYGLSSICSMLLGKGASTSAIDNKGQTALHLAAQYGFSDVHTDILCVCYCGEDSIQAVRKKMSQSEKNAPDSRRDDGDPGDGSESPLMEEEKASSKQGGIKSGMKKSVKADLGKQQTQRNTGAHDDAIMPAAYTDSIAVDRQVLDFIGVVRSEYIEILDMLLRSSASNSVAVAAINLARTVDGATPLHLAAQAGFTEAFLPLLKYGANPSIADREGRTPIECARDDGVRSVLSAATGLIAGAAAAAATATVESMTAATITGEGEAVGVGLEDVSIT